MVDASLTDSGMAFQMTGDEIGEGMLINCEIGRGDT